MFAYDVYAPGWGVRTKPVVVTSAQHVGFDGTEFYCEKPACFVNRSYSFLDGFGRVREQHSVSPGGVGGRVVVATDYDERGNAWRSSSALFDTKPALASSGLLNPDYSSVESYSVTEFDWAGRAISEKLMDKLAEVRETTYAYEPSKTTTTSASDAVSEVHTDMLGRMTSQVLHPESGYDLNAAHVTTYEYDFLDADAVAAGIASGEFENESVVGGTRVTVIDPELNETVFVSNLAGQRIHLTDPNSGESTYLYDENGQVKTIKSEAGDIEMGYDILGRLISRTSTLPGSTVVSSSASWKYSTAVPHIGVLEKETASTVVGAGTLTPEVFTTVTTMNYGTGDNVLHQPLSSTTTLPTHTSLGDLSGYEYTRNFDYSQDPMGRARVTLPAIGGLEQETPVTEYNRFGQAVSLSIQRQPGLTPSANVLVSGVDYDNVGRFVAREYANGVTRSLEWDTQTGVMTDAQVWHLSNPLDPLSAKVFLQWDEYSHDVAGRVTQVSDLITRAPGTFDEYELAQCYEYDDFNRLANAWTVDPLDSGDCGAGAPGATDDAWHVDATGYAAAWTYSPSGRMETQNLWDQAESVGGVPGAVSVDEQVFTYDPARPHAVTEITRGANADEYEYDDAGRLVSRTVDGVQTVFVWDVSSNLTRSVINPGTAVESTQSYIYSAGGQRVARITETEATAYFGETEVRDTDLATSGAGVVGTRYYVFGGATVAYREATGEFQLVFGDVQGSATLVMPNTDPTASGFSVTRNAYTPYGSFRGGDQLADTDRGWLNQIEDHTTELVYLNARYYDPTMGRFLSPDPVMNPGDPRTLDPYRYAENNPVVYVDPTGLCSGLSGAQLRACEVGGSLGAAYAERAKKRYARLDRRPSISTIVSTYQVTDWSGEKRQWGPAFRLFGTEELNPREIKVLKRVAEWDFPGINNARVAAEDNSKKWFPVGSSLDGNHHNAMKHALAAARYTLVQGEDFSRDFTTAHEGVPGHAVLLEVMDLWNNEAGVRIALDNPDATDHEIEVLVAQAVMSGEMLVVGGDGNLHWSNEVSWADPYLPVNEAPDQGRDYDEFIEWLGRPASGGGW